MLLFQMDFVIRYYALTLETLLLFSQPITEELIIKKTYSSENFPPTLPKAASRRQVTPLCPLGQRPYRLAA
jgi:hypothetical protein